MRRSPSGLSNRLAVLAQQAGAIANSIAVEWAKPYSTELELCRRALERAEELRAALNRAAEAAFKGGD